MLPEDGRPRYRKPRERSRRRGPHPSRNRSAGNRGPNVHPRPELQGPPESARDGDLAPASSHLLFGGLCPPSQQPVSAQPPAVSHTPFSFFRKENDVEMCDNTTGRHPSNFRTRLKLFGQMRASLASARSASSRTSSQSVATSH